MGNGLKFLIADRAPSNECRWSAVCAASIVTTVGVRTRGRWSARHGGSPLPACLGASDAAETELARPRASARCRRPSDDGSRAPYLATCGPRKINGTVIVGPTINVPTRP